MIGGVVIVLVTSLISFWLIDHLKSRHAVIDRVFLKRLFFYHLLLTLAYYGYALFNPSDSKYYYEKVVTNFRGSEWFDYFGPSTTFVEFVAFPFIKYFSFSYEAVMALFSFFGFIGFIYFYIFFRENVRFKHHFIGFDLIKIFFLLPNLHFWASSFGKGSIIFMGMGLFFYGISRVPARVIAIVVGGLIIYYVRPHIMLVVLVSSAVAFFFSARNVPLLWRIFFIAAAAVAFAFIYRDVFNMVGIDEEDFLAQSLDLTHRATELTKATSGVDITSYGLPFQVFTFLYRPLFIDAPGSLGLFVSFENAFYVLISLPLLLSISGWRFLATSNFLVKTAFMSFITVSIALAQISGNLGLAMRQKSQVMILLLFVVLQFLEEKKLKQYMELKWRRKRREKLPSLKTAQPVP